MDDVTHFLIAQSSFSLLIQHSIEPVLVIDERRASGTNFHALFSRAGHLPDQAGVTAAGLTRPLLEIMPMLLPDLPRL